MMGVTHGLSGGVIWIAGGLVVGLPPDEILLGSVLTAGSSILPDIDHPGSTVSRSLGKLSQGFAWLVSKIAGGHRNGTHSLIGVLILLGISLSTTLVGFGWIWSWLMILSVLVLVGKEKGLLIGLVAAILTLAWYHVDDPGMLPVWCLTIGMVVHILGDMVTYGGCPVFYPDRKRYSLGLFKTDSVAEKFVYYLLSLALIVLLTKTFGIW